MISFSGKKIGLTGITVAAVTIALLSQQILVAEPSDARGPVVTGRYEISRGAPTKLPTPGVGCSEVDGNSDGIADAEPDEFYDDSAEGEYTELKWYIDAKCIADDYTGLDPSGPSVTPIEIKLTTRVSGLASGWGLCEDEVAWQSFDVHHQKGFVSAPSAFDSFEDLGYIFLAGGGGPISTTESSEEGWGYSYAGNSGRPVFTPWALVCGPDASASSGIGWKVLQGRAIRLPALSKWPQG
jgi:hypothetical protein